MRWFRRSSPSSTRFRLLYATDLHGADRVFRKLVNAALTYEADAVVIGGDLTGKVLVPLIHQPDGSWLLSFYGETRHLTTDSEADEVAAELADTGHYVLRCTAALLVDLEAEPTRRDTVFLELMRERLVAWAALVRERLAPHGIRFYWNCGNDDPIELDAYLRDLPGVDFLEGRAVQLENGFGSPASAQRTSLPGNARAMCPKKNSLAASTKSSPRSHPAIFRRRSSTSTARPTVADSISHRASTRRSNPSSSGAWWKRSPSEVPRFAALSNATSLSSASMATFTSHGARSGSAVRSVSIQGASTKTASCGQQSSTFPDRSCETTSS